MTPSSEGTPEQPAGEASGFTLHIYPPEGSPETRPMTKELLVGRDPICDVVLDHPTVSGNHALLALKGNSVAITDLDSTNGTVVDESPAQPEIWTRQSAVIRIGAYRLDLIARHDQGRQRTAQIRTRGPALDDRDKVLIRALMRDWTDPAVRVPAPTGASEMAAEMHCSRQEVNRRVAKLEKKLGVTTEARGPRRYRDLTEELLRRGLQPGPD